MSENQSAKSLLAATLLLAALLVGISRAVQSAPLIDWWLPFALFVLGLALALSDWFRARMER
jgi:hypothetical protein